MGNRKNPKISKRGLLYAVNLFESKVDDTITNIKVYKNVYYMIVKNGGAEYRVDISKNTVEKIQPDLDY